MTTNTFTSTPQVIVSSFFLFSGRLLSFYCVLMSTITTYVMRMIICLYSGFVTDMRLAHLIGFLSSIGVAIFLYGS